MVLHSGCNRTTVPSLRSRTKSHLISRHCGAPRCTYRVWSYEFVRGLNAQPTRPRLWSPSSTTYLNESRSSCASISCHDHSLMSSSTNQYCVPEGWTVAATAVTCECERTSPSSFPSHSQSARNHFSAALFCE